MYLKKFAVEMYEAMRASVLPHWPKAVLLLGLVSAVFPFVPLLAQTTYGTILGSVTDSSDAGIPGAKGKELMLSPLLKR